MQSCGGLHFVVKERPMCGLHNMKWSATCFETPDLDYIVSMVDMNVGAQME
jgi:hypothetical protein